MNEIETIICKVCKCDRSRLYLERSCLPLNYKQYNRLQKILKKRIAGEPLQYLVGDAEFMGLRFRIKPGVLIPRPETEILVQEALERLSAFEKPSVLDIGTGSGNIAISLARFLSQAHIYAVDISPLCLTVARYNARFNHVQDKVKFLKSDLFSCFKNKKMAFDAIISNPPYIAESEYDKLPQDVRREPKEALLAQEDGLYFYSRIEEDAKKYLNPCGFIFLEIGYGQSSSISRIFGDSSQWGEAHFIRDHNDIERVAVIKRV